MRAVRILLPIAVSSVALLASAAETFNIRPGLWTTHSSITFGGAPLYVAEMNAAQRAEYAKSWAQTVNKPSTDDDEDCITAKDIQEAALLKDLKDDSKSCKESDVKVTATSMTAAVTCQDGNVTSRTQMNFAASSPTSFKGTIKTTMSSPNGVTTMNATMSGTFKSASCPKEDSDEGEGDDEDDGGDAR
jgi:hypothetical protein